MKKLLYILAFIIGAVLLSQMFLLNAFAAETTVTNQTELTNAIKNASNGDTVKISGTVTLSSGFSWPTANKTVKISGGTLDFSAISNLSIGTGVNFENTSIIFKAGANVYANGNPVTIAQSATVTNAVNLFGGKNGGTLNGDTNLTVMSGTYAKIYGGSNGGTINGSTHVTIGGNVNSTVDWTNHDGSNNIYGGGYNTVINGDTYLTVGGNAYANYIFGGSVGGSSKISGRSYLFFNDNAKAMSLYGASNGVNTGNDVTLIMSGGEIQQMFGGTQGASLGSSSNKVEVVLKVLGGKVSRRIYGGCYNNYDMTGSGGWSSSHSVYGNIILTIGKNANITLDYTETKLGFIKISPDDSLFGRSRRQTKAADENAIIIFLADTDSDTGSSSAYGKYNKKLGLSTLKPAIDSNVTVADEIHVICYSADGATLSEKCILSDCSHSSSLSLKSTETDVTYTGSPIEFAKLEYQSSWKSGSIDSLTYANNVNVGTANAVASISGKTVAISCTIDKATRNLPSTVSKSDETVKGKNDGKIKGLTSAMEYSTSENGPYSDITGTSITLPVGTYYVRYKETDCYKASSAKKFVIGEGRLLAITFVADTFENVTKYVEWNATLTDIPQIPEREGYTDTAPYWSENSFSEIKNDITVNAVYTPNKLSVTFISDGEVVAVRTLDYGTKLSDIPEVPQKEGYTGSWSVTDFSNVKTSFEVTAVYTETKQEAQPEQNDEPKTEQEEEEEKEEDQKETELNKDTEASTSIGSSNTVDKYNTDQQSTSHQITMGCSSVIGCGTWVAIMSIGVLALKKKD